MSFSIREVMKLTKKVQDTYSKYLGFVVFWTSKVVAYSTTDAEYMVLFKM